MKDIKEIFDEMHDTIEKIESTAKKRNKFYTIAFILCFTVWLTGYVILLLQLFK